MLRPLHMQVGPTNMCFRAALILCRLAWTPWVRLSCATRCLLALSWSCPPLPYLTTLRWLPWLALSLASWQLPAASGAVLPLTARRASLLVTAKLSLLSPLSHSASAHSSQPT